MKLNLSEIVELKVDDKQSYVDFEGNALKYLQPISSINILVGANNSGKSRMLRHLASRASVGAKIANLDELISSILDGINAIHRRFIENRITMFGEIKIEGFEELTALLSDVHLDLSRDTLEIPRQRVSTWRLADDPLRVNPSLTRVDIRNLLSEFRPIIEEIKTSFDKIPIYGSHTLPRRVYIPSIRGLRPISDDHHDHYFHATIKAYFTETTIWTDGQSANDNNGLQVFTGLSLYKDLTASLLGDNRERQAIANYQTFISETLFEGKSVALIPSPKHKVVVVKIGNEQERPIHELGDGIQSAIILSYLPFTIKGPAFFFIEEPEMYMHPGLQRKILEFFSRLPDKRFFLTTHSNHFLDLSIDIKEVSIFTFSKHLEAGEDDKTATFSVENVDSGCSSSLELLGVRNSSVFLVNSTIWVEGITDRLYLRKFLNLYVDRLKETNPNCFVPEEDVHYSFVEYGGANIVHWSFLDLEQDQITVERLCAKALVIADGDGATKMERKAALEEKIGDRFVQLPVMEIENLLPYDVIKSVVLALEKTPDREVRSFNRSDYGDEKLGRFIEYRILKKEVLRKGGYKADSGTLKAKLDFCESALPLLTYEALDEDVNPVIEKIYEFIREQNSEQPSAKNQLPVF